MATPSFFPTEAEVKAIIPTQKNVSVFVNDAFLLVERCISPLEDDLKKAILKWVAAHLIASTDEANKTSETLGSASNTYHRATLGSFLDGTTYGQQAIALDPNGCLAKLGKTREKAFVKVI